MTEPSRHPSSPWRAVLILLAAMAVAATLIVGGRALLHREEPGPAPTPTTPTTAPASESPSPTGPIQQSLLVQVRDDVGLAVASELITVQRDRGGSVLPIPPRLLVDPPGGPQTVFEATAASTTPTQSQRALSDLLGVKVDASWAMDRLAFAGLVDSIGGVYLDVKTPVVVRGPDLSVLVSLPVGIQRLDGVTAATYVLTRQPGEPEADRQARLVEVMRQVFVRLPKDQGTVELLLGSLGSLSRTTVPADVLSELLLRIRAVSDRAPLDAIELPVRTVAVGSAHADRLEFVPAERVVDDHFAAVRLVPGPDVPVRVLVFSGTGRPAVAATSREPLEKAGYVYLTGGATQRTTYATSKVIVPAGSPGSRSWAVGVAATLRLPTSAVVVSDGPRTTADVVVILGADYRPLVPPVPDPTLTAEPSPKP